MKTPARLLLLSFAIASLNAQPESGETTAAALKEKLIASVKADMAKAGENDPRVSSSLTRFFHSLQQIESNESYRETELQRLAMHLPDGSVSDQTRTLLESYSKQLKSEADAAREKFLKEVDETGRAFIKRAMASNDSAQSAAIEAEVQDWANTVSNKSFRDSSKVNSQIYGLKNCVSSLSRFQAARADENWRNAAGQLEQLRENFSKIRQFLPAEEAETYLENARRSIGLLSPKELQATFDKTVDELFNDANQDRLEEIADQIRKYQQLCSSSSSSAMTAMSARWQQLSSLANTFIQNVQIVQNGGTSRFSPEQWLRSSSESKSVMTRAQLIDRLKNYKVRVIGENSRVEPMYDDIRDILGRIRNLGDIQKELPAFQKAARLSSYESESGNWSAILPALNYYADLNAKLETGDAFVLRNMNNPYSSESMRYYPQAANDIAAEKITTLRNQAQWNVLHRFFPEIKTDLAANPNSTIKALLEKSIAAKNYEAILNLNQTVAFFAPDQQLLGPSEILAIQHYLAGVRQNDQLSEPRLATCYLQKAAAIRSSVIPADDLKARLQKLKHDFPADYEKGTDDSFRQASEEPSRFPPVLNVPAAK